MALSRLRLARRRLPQLPLRVMPARSSRDIQCPAPTGSQKKLDGEEMGGSTGGGEEAT